MIQNNKRTFFSEQNQRASFANPLMFAQKRKSEKTHMVEWPSKQAISSAVLGKGEPMKKPEKKYDRYLIVEKALFDSGARCLRQETSSDKRMTLEFFINNGRLVILQHFPDLDGIEIFRPVNEVNNLDQTIKDTIEWFGVKEKKAA